LNLINNAFQAVQDVAKPEVIVSTRNKAKGIEIRVKDNGPGIPNEIRHKIFQPFFTTKAAGEGTGLGLSLSYDIITKGHGGTIEVSSEVEKGTAFLIKLPY
jgi:signal transduction histidine kinase